MARIKDEDQPVTYEEQKPVSFGEQYAAVANDPLGAVGSGLNNVWNQFTNYMQTVGQYNQQSQQALAQNNINPNQYNNGYYQAPQQQMRAPTPQQVQTLYPPQPQQPQNLAPGAQTWLPAQPAGPKAPEFASTIIDPNTPAGAFRTRFGDLKVLNDPRVNPSGDKPTWGVGDMRVRAPQTTKTTANPNQGRAGGYGGFYGYGFGGGGGGGGYGFSPKSWYYGLMTWRGRK